MTPGHSFGLAASPPAASSGLQVHLRGFHPATEAVISSSPGAHVFHNKHSDHHLRLADTPIQDSAQQMLEDMKESYCATDDDDSFSEEAMLSVVVVGASGDLAKKKIFPALFALYFQGLLPKHCQIFGYARSKSSTEDFREKIRHSLPCRIDNPCAPLPSVMPHVMAAVICLRLQLEQPKQ